MCIIRDSFTEFDKKGSRIETYPLSVARKTDRAGEKSSIRLPPWFDRARFDESRTILNDYFMSIFWCHLAGLVLLIFIETIHRTLSLSGKSRDLISLFYRYMHTIMHVKKWYEGAVYDPDDPAYHSLLLVKEMHQKVANQQNRQADADRPVALSQRDMTLTQFAFIGLIVLHPEKMGFSSRPTDFERLTYFWRCIGYMLGIDDEYNLCDGDHRAVREKCALVFANKFRPNLAKMRAEQSEMSEQIVITVNHYITLMSYRGLLAYVFEVTEMTDTPSYRKLTLDRSDWLFYVAVKWFVGKLAHWLLIRIALNNLLRFAFYRLSSESYVDSIVKCLERIQLKK